MKANLPEKKCAFCGDYAKLTGEHIWPDWLQHHVPKLYRQTEHAASQSMLDVKSGQRFERKKNSVWTGDPTSRKLKIVCQSCNGGWMSRLQGQAKPLLLPLMNGTWPGISNWDRRVLAAWATMFTMVIEYADPKTQVSSFEQREFLRLSLEPPSGSYFWMAPFNGTKWHGVFNHFGWSDPFLTIPEDQAQDYLSGRILPRKPNRQSTAFVLGRLFMMTFSFGEPDGVFDQVAFSKRHSLVSVWPQSSDAIVRPSKTLDDIGADFVGSSIQPMNWALVRRAWEV